MLKFKKFQLHPQGRNHLSTTSRRCQQAVYLQCTPMEGMVLLILQPWIYPVLLVLSLPAKQQNTGVRAGAIDSMLKQDQPKMFQEVKLLYLCHLRQWSRALRACAPLKETIKNNKGN